MVHVLIKFHTSSLSDDIDIDPFQKAVSHRNVAFLAAVRELEEASAAEGIINCMRYTVYTLLRFALYFLVVIFHIYLHLSME